MSEETKLLACPFCGGKPIVYSDEDDKNNYVRCYVCGAQTDRLAELDNSAEAIAAWNRRAPAAGGEDIDPQRIHVTGSGQAYVFEPHINPDGSEDAREVPLAFAGWSEKKDRRVSGVKTRRVAGSATYAGPFRREAFADRRAQAGAGVLTAEEHDFLLVLCSMIRRAISDDPANRLLAITRRLTAQGGSDV